MEPVSVRRGGGPVVLGIPHAGTFLPEDEMSRLNERGRALADTDWHVDRLYDGLLDDATIVRANFHRYLIDANRDPSGVSLYPGQNTTGLCPLTDFDGESIYRADHEPDAAETERRRAAWHAPYHDALEAELERARQLHGAAILYDCHSIRSLVPFLFEGVLPDFNIGTDNGATCAASIERGVENICQAAEGYTTVTNGRFRGGWTTRHYGRPAEGLHAIQMELTQSAYLESEAAPFAYDTGKAERLRVHLRAALKELRSLALAGVANEEE